MPVEPERPEGPTPPTLEREPARARAGRYGQRTALYLWLAILVVGFVLFVILVVQNTERVKVGWIFGHSRVSLAILVVFAAAIGWVLGLATAFLIRRRTRRPLTAREVHRPADPAD